ncbi:MAG: type II toxin-antitoxin system VapC family toxin [bacterium]|nr:type II toxin-antitoxin system VapC family toxin [bacterium]
MIVLDTNVVSELMRPQPNSTVATWISNRSAATLFLSSVTEAELLYGVAIMPAGQRKDALKTGIKQMLREDFAGRVLPFDSDAARAYASIAASCRTLGRSISQSDAQIAAIARSRGMAVATRNIRHFEQMAVELIDPWVTG